MGRLVPKNIMRRDQQAFSIDTRRILEQVGNLTQAETHRVSLHAAEHCEMSDGHADVALGLMYLDQLGLL